MAEDKKDMKSVIRTLDVLESASAHGNLLSGNKFVERAFERAERIVAGIFLVTGHLDPGLPSVEEVHRAAISILPKTLALKDELRSSYSVRFADLRSGTRYLVSLLKILAISGKVSEQNAAILIGAISDLVHYLHSARRSPLAEESALDPGDFVHSVTDSQKTSAHKDKGETAIKDRIHVKDMGNVSNIKRTSNTSIMLRAQSVLSVLKTRGPVGVKDIASELPELSEKMIQRELLAMVARGEVQKVGSKRWSKYSIAS